jgi:hypothetical protein
MQHGGRSVVAPSRQGMSWAQIGTLLGRAPQSTTNLGNEAVIWQGSETTERDHRLP